MARKILAVLFVVLSFVLIGLQLPSSKSETNNTLLSATIQDVGSAEYVLELTDGEEITVAYDPIELAFAVGDSVIVAKNVFEGETTYTIQEPSRIVVFVLLFVLFAMLVLFVARMAGVYALISLFFTVVVILFGFIPLLLAGYSPMLITLGLGSLVMMGIVLLSHGVNQKSLVALGSILVTLFFAVLLAVVSLQIGLITGLQDESLRFLLFDFPELDVVGVIIAAMILGLLGVLDDVAVSQSSVVFELAKANTTFSFWELYQSASVVGRDHIVSIVNTLALAYIGASLPLILLVFAGGFADMYYVLQFEVLAVELIRILVGSIGIVVCIPLTTLLACFVVKRKLLQTIEEGESQGCGCHEH